MGGVAGAGKSEAEVEGAGFSWCGAVPMRASVGVGVVLCCVGGAAAVRHGSGVLAGRGARGCWGAGGTLGREA